MPALSRLKFLRSWISNRGNLVAKSVAVAARQLNFNWRATHTCMLSALACCRLHCLAQAEGAHIRPDLFDVGQTLFFGTALAGILPAERDGQVCGPDRILLLVIYDDAVCHILIVFLIHGTVYPPVITV